MLSDQSPKQLLAIRTNLYELLVHAIPPRTIIKTMVEYLITGSRVDDSLRAGIVEKAALFEVRSRSSNKAIFHLEAFVVGVMTMIKGVSIASYSGEAWEALVLAAATDQSGCDCPLFPSFPSSSYTWASSGTSLLACDVLHWQPSARYHCSFVHSPFNCNSSHLLRAKCTPYIPLSP